MARQRLENAWEMVEEHFEDMNWDRGYVLEEDIEGCDYIEDLSRELELLDMEVANATPSS